jgi:hypothetical protein
LKYNLEPRFKGFLIRFSQKLSHGNIWKTKIPPQS